jgi:predicted nucleotidyltransferase
MALHPDFVDLLAAFAEEKVEYLIIGGYAVAFHGRPRFTKDIDLWIGVDPENLSRATQALALFGAPPALVSELRALGPEQVLYLGRPPVRVDILRSLGSLSFEEAYARRIESEWDGVCVNIVSLADLLASKRAAGRSQDIADVEILERIQQDPATRKGDKHR